MASLDLLDNADLLKLGLVAASDPGMLERLLALIDAEETEHAEEIDGRWS